MSGACAGAAYHSYANMNNPRMAGIKLAFAGAYLWGGCAACLSGGRGDSTCSGGERLSVR
jgi:hypothetical protein